MARIRSSTLAGAHWKDEVTPGEEQGHREQDRRQDVGVVGRGGLLAGLCAVSDLATAAW